ncbi:C4-dicarboxylate TRAP transporter substrate-binding protein [Salinimonas iocasae]|uniref:C4-dicarboxylate ABC transporter n=1 Tax=Salinimonas iocasae TaxID=2572577 RepID=A0A5B7YA49_9ALTE|nr:C4-dicarboxylate TRAP transporter substrate-binding protein [Salinimonas iocasae]QCZ92206.1 C4-dicarboxylate ABC transporter [Salinimonas iocasae]
MSVFEPIAKTFRTWGTACLRKCVLSVAAFLSLAMPVAADSTLNVITSLSTNDPMYEGLVKFKNQVETASQGRLSVRIFVGSQLGNDSDMLEQAMLGANVAVLADGGRLAVYQNELGILGAPYLVEDYGQLNVLVDSPLFSEWADSLATRHGLHIFSFNWWQGARHLLTQKPVSAPADLQGIRMRTIGAPVWIQTIDAMGATPTPLAWAEVYSGLQQQVIDAAEAQYTGMWGARLYEVITHVTKTGHIQLISGLVGSERWYQSLSLSQQKIVTRAAIEAGRFASKQVRAEEVKIEEALKARGVVIAEPDTTPFRQSAKVVYKNLGYAALFRDIQTLLQEADDANDSSH